MVLLTTVITACGSSSKSASPTTAGGATETTTGHGATSQICAQADDLKSSIDDLKQVNVVQNGVSSLRTALDKVKSTDC